MSITPPYMPTVLATPIVSPALGSSGANPVPYLSPSQYIFAPTAMDTDNLVPNGAMPQQVQALSDTILRASRWIDRHCFGGDPAAKGASLAASLSVQSVNTKPKAGMLKLICDYKPILQVVGIDVGTNPSNPTSIGPSISAMVSLGRRTIYVPYFPTAIFSTNNQAAPAPTYTSINGGLFVVWSYVNGYPHTMLTANVAQGATSCVVASTDGNGGLWGVYPASGSFLGSELTVYDGAYTETLYVQGITTGSSTTTLTTSPFQYAHNIPTMPDFLPMTAIPAEVQQAAIFMTTALIKTRGDNSIVLDELRQPRSVDQYTGDQFTDMKLACDLLRSYRVHLKGGGT